ncbi:unnamed protein product [Soboliphyme baturini]|uniref:Transthyretin-like family protein n=1 Tax=Soboliphyme baturini TaxID=241478 RepID=A0A183IYH9_9BILA|nr:unnamed protein product [Soboliphyme baturini]
MRFGACLSVVAFAVTLRLTYAKVKCVSAEGMIICPKDPDKVADVEVYLMDADGFLNSDDTMGWTISNENGDFRVDGCGDDFWSVPDPYLKIKPSRGSKEQANCLYPVLL